MVLANLHITLEHSTVVHRSIDVHLQMLLSNQGPETHSSSSHSVDLMSCSLYAKNIDLVARLFLFLQQKATHYGQICVVDDSSLMSSNLVI